MCQRRSSERPGHPVEPICLVEEAGFDDRELRVGRRVDRGVIAAEQRSPRAVVGHLFGRRRVVLRPQHEPPGATDDLVDDASEALFRLVDRRADREGQIDETITERQLTGATSVRRWHLARSARPIDRERADVDPPDVGRIKAPADRREVGALPGNRPRAPSGSAGAGAVHPRSRLAARRRPGCGRRRPPELAGPLRLEAGRLGL